MATELAAVKAVIYGRVQGVFFRAFTKQLARQLGVAGYVRNLPNGAVEVQAEGEPGKLQDLVHSLKDGPTGAQVDRIDLKWEKFKGRFSQFEVR